MQPESKPLTATQNAWNAFIKVINSKPWFDKFFHTDAHEALETLAKYLQTELVKEGSIPPPTVAAAPAPTSVTTSNESAM